MASHRTDLATVTAACRRAATSVALAIGHRQHLVCLAAPARAYIVASGVGESTRDGDVHERGLKASAWRMEQSEIARPANYSSSVP